MDDESPQRDAPAFYALPTGGWRDYWTLVHPPYTLWHLSYVAIGAALAPHLRASRLAWSLLAFFLAIGVSAHALDELEGRPLRTRIPSSVLAVLGFGGLAGALGLGIRGAQDVSWWLVAFIVVGAVLVPAYNMEWAGGVLHTDLAFALGWGAFPVLVGYFAQDGTIGVPAVVAAAACAALASVQRVLSTRARLVRRKAIRIEGELTLEDGTSIEITPAWLRAGPEGALRVLWIAMVLLAAALVAARL